MSNENTPPTPEDSRIFPPLPEFLRRAVFDNPYDDAPRLIAADWLEENEDFEFSQFIKLQIKRSTCKKCGGFTHGMFASGTWVTATNAECDFCKTLVEEEKELIYGKKGKGLRDRIYNPKLSAAFLYSPLMLRGFPSAMRVVTSSFMDAMSNYVKELYPITCIEIYNAPVYSGRFIRQGGEKTINNAIQCQNMMDYVTAFFVDAKVSLEFRVKFEKNLTEGSMFYHGRTRANDRYTLFLPPEDAFGCMWNTWREYYGHRHTDLQRVKVNPVAQY